ncbi:MAG: NFACT RNA binding domain-containing protein [Bacteroidota bacterium]
MHIHHITLAHLAAHLNATHLGERLERCFSQNKQELVVEFEQLILRIGCNTPLSYVVSVGAFGMARKNVVTLFTQLQGLALKDVRVVPFDRILIFTLESEWEMVLKMYGNRSNILLLHAGEVKELFRSDIATDWEFEETNGPSQPEVALEPPEAYDLKSIQAHLRKISPIYDRHFAQGVLRQMKQGANWTDAWKKVREEAIFETFFICREATRIRFLALPPIQSDDCIAITGVVPALKAFLSAQFQYDGYRKRYAKVKKELEKPVQKFQKVFASYRQNIDQLKTERNPEEIGHILMANLHAIPPDTAKIELEDFYTGGKLLVKLKPRLSPQENAKRYYDKHKQRKSKITYLESQLEDIEAKLNEATGKLVKFEELPVPTDLPFDDGGFDARQLRAYKKEMDALYKEQEAEQEKRFPFRTFSRENWQIFVGLNAKNNDLLSFKFANKEDLWLHAKDVSGSHVVIKQRPGHPVPETVLEYAAGLAAYYSKRKNDGLVPVIYTPRKYIRKRKGDPPGLVAVDREQVIMAEPTKG